MRAAGHYPVHPRRSEEAHIFIDYMCQPAIQATLARKVGTSPTVKRDSMDLTAEEFAAVSSDIDPVIPRFCHVSDTR